MFYIYTILNTVTGKQYIGSTRNYKRRKIAHTSALNRGIHHSKKLQNAWNKYGANSFQFVVLFSGVGCDEDRQAKEQEYLNNYKPNVIGYNMASNVTCGWSGVEWTEEMRESVGQKVSAKLKGKTPKNLEAIRNVQRRAVIEYENGIPVKEYASCKQAGEQLGVDYKLINNVLRGKVKRLKLYPNKTWAYKDGQPARVCRINPNSGHKRGKHKRVAQYDETNEIVRVYNSLDEAAEQTGLHKKTIQMSCLRCERRIYNSPTKRYFKYAD